MLYTKTVDPTTRQLLKKLMTCPTLAQCYLVGGTNLALQRGHRQSLDMDLFCINGFDSKEYIIHSLSYLDDAERQPDPLMVKGYSWEEIKKKIERVVKDYILC